MNELTKNVETPQEKEFALLQRMSRVFYASGMFPDLKSEAQAIVKALVGRELGLSIFASITGIHLVSGKPVIGANLIATMIAKHPTYSYRILKDTKEICEIEFYDSHDKSSNENSCLGTSSFTIQEAQEAGLLGKDNWKKYAKDMLFARTISRGAKRFTPGIFGGTAVYTPDEMGVDTDEDGVIEMPLTPPKPGAVAVDAVEVHPEPGSDEAIIEEFKKTHEISEGGF